jgi:hypothetical protein
MTPVFTKDSLTPLYTETAHPRNEAFTAKREGNGTLMLFVFFGISYISKSIDYSNKTTYN